MAHQREIRISQAKLLGMEDEFGQFPQIFLRNFSDSSLDEGTMVGIGGTLFVQPGNWWNMLQTIGVSFH